MKLPENSLIFFKNNEFFSFICNKLETDAVFICEQVYRVIIMRSFRASVCFGLGFFGPKIKTCRNEKSRSWYWVKQHVINGLNLVKS